MRSRPCKFPIRHHAAVSAQGVDVEVDQVLKARLVEVSTHPPPGDVHATLLASPWPSGPVVVSTPLVQRYSGWPGQRLSSCRKRLIASNSMAARRGSRSPC